MSVGRCLDLYGWLDAWRCVPPFLSQQSHASDPIEEEELCKLIDALQPNDHGVINYEEKVGMYVSEGSKSDKK
jgi:Ca2+-binding EF-hand superfamily protein